MKLSRGNQIQLVTASPNSPPNAARSAARINHAGNVLSGAPLSRAPNATSAIKTKMAPVMKQKLQKGVRPSPCHQRTKRLHRPFDSVAVLIRVYGGVRTCGDPFG